MKLDEMNWKRSMTRGVAVVMTLCLVSLGAMSTASADEVKIGYVDLHRALEESDEGQKIISELEQEFQQRQQQLDQAQQEIMQKQEQFEQQAMMMSEEQRQQQGAQLQQEMQQLQQTYMTLQNELAQQEAEATSRLLDEMSSVIEGIAEEQDFTMVIEKTETSVLYSVDGLDLTDELIDRYNAN